jgi:hypothetical protein
MPGGEGAKCEVLQQLATALVSLSQLQAAADEAQALLGLSGQGEAEAAAAAAGASSSAASPFDGAAAGLRQLSGLGSQRSFSAGRPRISLDSSSTWDASSNQAVRASARSGRQSVDLTLLLRREEEVLMRQRCPNLVLCEAEQQARQQQEQEQHQQP